MTAPPTPPPGPPRAPLGWAPPPVPRHVAGPPVRHVGWLMVAVAVVTCGLAGFVPPLWAATRRGTGRARRAGLGVVAAVLVAVSAGGTVLVGVAPEGPDGDPAGWQATVGALAFGAGWLSAVVVAVLVRGAGDVAELPGVAEELERRRLRERYRALAAGDPAMARAIGVGRPDLPRGFDDGGLLDLNGVGAPPLAWVLGASAAARVVEARQRLGRFTSLDEVAVYAELPEGAVERLREHALLL